MERWADLPAVWRLCFELAWESYGRDSTPVGAVLMDVDGCEVARGANTRYGRLEDGGLAGSHLAHAEVIALSRLSSERSHDDCALYTTLEPCLLCVGAAVMSTVGHVYWAGIDPYGGATTLLGGENAHLARHITRFHGPLDDIAGVFAAALHVEFYLRRNPTGHVVAAYNSAAPKIVEAAHVLADLGASDAASAGTPAEVVFDRAASSLAQL